MCCVISAFRGDSKITHARCVVFGKKMTAQERMIGKWLAVIFFGVPVGPLVLSLVVGGRWLDAAALCGGTAAA
jgi:hypothetical protein